MKSINNMVKKLLTVMAAVMVVTSFGFAPGIVQKSFAEAPSGKMIAGAEALKEGVNTENARLVHYGDRYWYVIGYDREGVAAGSGEITLLSKDSIKSTAFDKNYKAVYSSSNLKNDIETYTNDKLSAGEKSAIVSRDLSAINARAKGDLKWWFNNFRTVDEVLDNPVEGAMLWPLSAKEATEVNENIRKTGTGYWLRSLGVPEYEERYWYGLEDFDVYVVPAAMATVWDDGSVDIQAEKENTTYWHGMRPAFKLNKNNIVMVSAATGGKESEEDGTLTETGAVTEKNLKLTVKDDAHKDFYVNPCDVEPGEPGSLTVKYSSASTGENEYISAVIKGADGSIKQYGRLAKATTASGTATIKGLPTDGFGKVSLPEGDKIYVLNEQYNGDEKTDYVSNLREISLTGHNWVFDDLKWNSRTSDVEASYHCSIDGNHFKTINEGEYKIEDIAPTCEEKGKQMQILSISAEKSLDGKAHSKSTKIDDGGEPLGHDYKAFLGFRWKGNASSGYTGGADAIFGCTRDYSHKTYFEANVTSKVQEPTCTAIGRTLYQATLSADKSPDGRDHGEAKYAEAKPRLGHDWDEPTYTWAADNSSVTATRVCKRDENHVETETVATEATNITKEPTCKAEGEGDVKTKPFTNEAFTEQTKTNATIPVDSNAHDWDDGEVVTRPDVCGGEAMWFTCKLCGEEKFEATDGAAHQWSEDYIAISRPTCTEWGDSFKVCEVCGIYNLEDPKPLEPTGHDWEFKGFTWTGDETDGYEKAVANYVCKHNESHKMTANVVISDEVKDPTCQEGGKTVYTATISASDSPDGNEHSESKDAKATDKINHEWEYSGMEWTGSETDGYTKAAAKYTCKFDCGEAEEVEAVLTEEETKADCEHDGKTVYTAKVSAKKSLTGEEHTDAKEAKVTEALGHDWHFKDMIWTGDEESGFTKAEAKFVCNNDESHEGLVEAKLTEEVTEPTCAEEGYTMYQAKVDAADSLNGAECTDVNFAKIKEPTGHAWELKGFTWTEDDKYGYRAVANYVCKHDESHAESVGADMRKTEKTATCEEPGGTLYTATVDKDKSLTDAEVTEDKLVKTSNPTGHKWGTPKYTWSRDNKSVTAQAVCEHDSKHIKKETVETTSKVTKKTTCKAAGSRTYTATFKDPLFNTQTRTETIAKTKTHTWSAWKVTRKATVYTAGTKTRTCSVCGKKETQSIPKLKVSGTLMMNAVASGSKALKLNWTKVNNAAGYDIYMARCNYRGRTYTCKKVKTISGNKTLSWTYGKLSKHTAYKGYVRAYTIKNGKKVYVRKSPLVHAFTGNYRNSLTNPKSIKVNKTSVSIARGKTATIKATVTKVRSGLGFPDNHEARVRYLTSNKKIATVNGSGKITAKSKGTCYVYAYAQNGLWKTVKVTVK